MQPMPPLARHNARQLYFDILWYGVLAGSAQAFLAVYLARLSATSFQVGLLTAGPAVVNLFVSLPAARWLERQSLIRATLSTSLWHRAGYPVLIGLPWLLSVTTQTWTVPAIIILMSVPGTVLAIAFNAMFADVVSPEWRAHVVGRRNALLALSMAATSLFSGWLLDLKGLPFPLNYQIVFALGALGAYMSSYYLARLRAGGPQSPRVNRPLLEMARPGQVALADAVRQAAGLRFLTRAGPRRLLRLDLLRGPFGPFLAALFLFYAFQFVPIPLFPLFFVGELQLTDGAISVGNALFHVTTLLISMRLSELTSRLSHRRVLTLSALFYGAYPLLIALAHNFTLYWIGSLAGGAVWGLASGSLVTRLMERVPDGDRPAHMALHNLALNCGILAGSLAGPLLAEWLGLRNALFLGAALRSLSGLLFMVWA